MNPIRKKRAATIAFLVIGSSVTLGVALFALQENINLFYSPDQIVSGAAPAGVRIRAGGVVEPESLSHAQQGLEVNFLVTDLQGSSFPVRFNGVLPGLFREGQGVIAVGTLNSAGEFQAEEILAKHDENYVPPEIEGIVNSSDS